jgi:hypothetical protein
MAKPGRFTMTDCSGAPLHSLGHRQGFTGDHRLQRGAGTLLSGGDGGVSLSEQRYLLKWRDTDTVYGIRRASLPKQMSAFRQQLSIDMSGERFGTVTDNQLSSRPGVRRARPGGRLVDTAPSNVP